MTLKRIQFPSPYLKELPDQIHHTKPPHFVPNDDICDRIVGSLVGLAIGDALGASVEFRPQTYLAANPVLTMKGGGTWGLQAGKWTDDTSMALCLAASLITENDFNPYDQMVRYKWWNRYGYLSSTGQCFDIGQATRQAINTFYDRQKLLKKLYRCRNDEEVDKLSWDSVDRIKEFHVFCGDTDAAGNGALMRLAPIPLFFFKTPTIAIKYANHGTRLTHASQKAIDASRYYAALIIAALNKESKEEILSDKFYETHRTWFGDEPLHQDIIAISRGSFKKTKGYEGGIRGKGYVVNALEAALWAFWSDLGSFEKGALNAVNLGDDTDTTAAIYGQLAGAYYGYKSIPKQWLDTLYAHDLLVSMGEWLHYQANHHSASAEGNQENTFLARSTNETPKSPSQDKGDTASSTLKSKYSNIHQENGNSNNDKRYSKQTSEMNKGTRTNHSNRSVSPDSTVNLQGNPIVSPLHIDPHFDDHYQYSEDQSSSSYQNGMENQKFYRNNSRK